MKKILCAVAFGAAFAVASTAANASVVFEYSIDGGAFTTVSGTGSPTTSTGTFSAGAWTISLSGSGSDNPATLTGQTISVTGSGPGTLNVRISDTGYTSPSGTVGFLSSFTNQPGTLMVAESTYADASNAAFGTATPLGTATFTGFGSSQSPGTASGLSTYSLTEQFLITAGASGGTANSTISISAVPEPSTWAMMILGFLGIGFVTYRKKAKVGFRFA